MPSTPPPSACPHCQGSGISEHSRSYSSRGWPAACQLCGKLSYNGSRALLFVTTIAVTTIAPAAILFFLSIGRGVAAFAILLITTLACIVVGRIADPQVMRPVTPAQRDVSRILTYVSSAIALAFLVAAFVFAFTYHHPD
jgi:hypothetical protein